jgi:hypothetical protein
MLELLIGLICLGLISYLICFWLVGALFARVVMVLVCVPAFAFLGCIALAAVPGATGAAEGLGAILGGVAGWLLAGWPTYQLRYRERLITAGEGYRLTGRSLVR